MFLPTVSTLQETFKDKLGLEVILKMDTHKKTNMTKRNRWDWLDNATTHENQGFTFPQIKPSLLLYETPASLSRKVPIVPEGPSDVVKLRTTKLGTKVFIFL